MQRRASLVQGLFAALALSPFVIAAGCASPASGGNTGGTNGNGGSNATGGSTGKGGSNPTGGTTGAGGAHTGGTNGNTGGNTGSGGVVNTGAGGSNTGAGGSNTGAGGSNTGSGGSHTGGTTGTGGSTTGAGGSGTGGSTTGLAGNSGNRACGAPASGDVIADFEEGTNQDVLQGGRQGWWSAFGDTTGTQTPAGGTTAAPAAAMVSGGAPTGDTCDMFALHSTGTGHDATSGYVGFGAPFKGVLPPPASGSTSATQMPYDVSAYSGVSFNIKSSSGTAPPIWVEFHNTKNVPAPDGTAQYKTVDQYNTRGMLLTGIGTTWMKVNIPFAIAAPRYLPSTSSMDCSGGTVFCQAPAWDAKNTLGIQFGIYPQYLVQPFTSATSLNYDVWVDDVSFYKGDDGLGTWTSTAGTAHPFPVDSPKVGSCSKPAGATGKDLIQMYNMWKKTFVTGTGTSMRVIRPENGNDTVSEGIGYGMLIAVYMGDKALFDGLWSYSQSGHTAVGTLMNWCIPAGGGSCSASGGSATDADEDIAFALIQAGKQWGGTYASTAATVIGDVWAHDIDTAAMLPNGGSNFGSGMQTNPSYWAPAYYRVFATIDTGHPWATVANNTYTALNAIAGRSTGNAAGALVPAWCSGANCGNIAGSGYTDGGIYQYDAHRVPWRFGLDACWNGTTTGATFLSKNAAFFANIAKNGIGRIVDIYSLAGTPNSDAAPNSMSSIGTAGVGAMAAGNSFADSAWQFLLDASYSPQSQIKDTMGHIGYTYFNATVGLLTALTLSGNFNNF